MSKTETYRRWTAEEVAYLRDNYGVKEAADIAKALGRTPDSIWEKSGREGLRKHAKRHERNEEGPWHCPSCNKDKPVVEFGKAAGGRGAPYCKVCTNRRQNEKRKAQRRKKS